MATTTTGRIVPGDESDIHDEPHIEGRRVTVRFVHAQVEGGGRSPSEVATEYDLPLADVYRALTYYHDNPEEMRAVERRRETAIEGHRDRSVSPEDVRD